MTARYQVRLKNQSGVQVALFDDWRSLSFSHQVNKPGSCSLGISGLDSRVGLFQLDGQIEIWRSDLANGLDWYNEWEGLVRSEQRQTTEEGTKIYTAYARGYVDLLARRIIAYAAGSAQAEKNGLAGETAMKQFVDENAGPGATSPPRLLQSGVTTGLTVQADGGLGGSWSGGRAYKNLLETLQKIAPQVLVDFDVIGTGAATFQFRTFTGQRGLDRTLDGLNPVTGLNAAGNIPVVFSLPMGNMQDISYTMSRLDEATAVFVAGQGVEAERQVVLRTNGPRIADSPWNNREALRDARNVDEDTGALNVVGDQALLDLARQEKFIFRALQLPGQLYGKHYTWGDSITARYDSIQVNKLILGVDVKVDEKGEAITPRFEDLT